MNKFTGRIPYEGIVSVKDIADKKPPFQNGWISVDDRLPETEDCVDVLCYLPNQIVILTFFPEDDEAEARFYFSFRNEMNHVTRVTHWMPLPEAPK